MVMRQTSLAAYAMKSYHGKVHHQIVELLRFFPGLTDYEIALKLGYANPNVVRPRRNELMQGGIVEECDQRKCTVTGKTALTWRLQ